MSGTTIQNCKCCETEDDCINGLCQLCSDYNQKLQKQSDLLTLDVLKEKNKHDTLKTSHAKLVEALKCYGKHNYPCKIILEKEINKAGAISTMPMSCTCGLEQALKEAKEI